VSRDTPIYEVRGLRHGYGARTVLDIAEWRAEAGAIVGVAGPNGSGKSTLLRLLGFVEKPREGDLRFMGKPGEPLSERVRFQVSLLPQEPYLLRRTVFQNVAYGLKLRGAGRGLAQRVSEALALVGLPASEFGPRPWSALSGGEAQRVALAARLALRPAVLLLDEPTASVDVASGQLIKEAAFRAREQWGTTLLVASHDQAWLYDVCDRVMNLFGGRLVGPGPTTLLHGPWEAREDGSWEKPLAENQRVRVSPPPAPNAVGMIEEVFLAAEGGAEAPAPGENRLMGRITRLAFERESGCLLATVMAGRQPFSVRVTEAEVRKRGLVPGGSVRIRFRSDAVRWI